MKRSKVIAFKNMPTRLPFWGAFVIWLMLDRLKPAGWIVGAAWAVYAGIAIASVIAFCTQKEVDVLDEEETAKRRVVTLKEGGGI